MSRLKVTLIRSAIGRTENQRKNLIGLGLTRLHRSVLQDNSPAIRGMVKKVIHLVQVDEIAD